MRNSFFVFKSNVCYQCVYLSRICWILPACSTVWNHPMKSTFQSKPSLKCQRGIRVNWVKTRITNASLINDDGGRNTTCLLVYYSGFSCTAQRYSSEGRHWNKEGSVHAVVLWSVGPVPPPRKLLSLGLRRLGSEVECGWKPQNLEEVLSPYWRFSFLTRYLEKWFAALLSYRCKIKMEDLCHFLSLHKMKCFRDFGRCHLALLMSLQSVL